MKPNPVVIVAMDVPNGKAAIDLASQLDPNLCRLKVGMELFTAEGPVIVEILRNLGFDIFLDLKFHDIPNTVAAAIRSAANHGVWMVNVHTLGGRKMMEVAVNAVSNIECLERPIIIGVTILTSMNDTALKEVGIDGQSAPLPIDYFTNPYWKEYPISKASLCAQYLAGLAKESGLDGVVCSGLEASAIRKATGGSFVLVTPGIRLLDGNQDDQARIVTPEIAIQSGASYLVVGRPITGAPDPNVALQEFNQRIASVQS